MEKSMYRKLCPGKQLHELYETIFNCLRKIKAIQGPEGSKNNRNFEKSP